MTRNAVCDRYTDDARERFSSKLAPAMPATDSTLAVLLDSESSTIDMVARAGGKRRRVMMP